MRAIDEACLSSKVYLGHVDALLGKCDAVLAPRIANFGKGNVLCTKFSALYDVVNNTFRDKGLQLVGYNVDPIKSGGELAAFLDFGKKLGKKKPEAFYAYTLAKQAERLDRQNVLRRHEEALKKPGIKLLIVGHSYNIYDKYIGRPVLDYLEAQGVTAILADDADRKKSLEAAASLTETMPWIFNREQMGAIELYRDKTDGLILLSAFPCGPDSLANETVIRRVKDTPVLNLLLDGQEGSAGVETRLESFIDIIRFRRGISYGEA
jgi:predicted nucleotide-binding protein (sugar kinase/HSP70/actin superfamily)